MAPMHCLRLAGLAPVSEEKRKRQRISLKSPWFLQQAVKVISVRNDLVGIGF